MSRNTKIPPQQRKVVVKTKGGSAGPSYDDAVKVKLPPLPRCEEHPRHELDLYCKLCQTAICSTCKEAEHSQCQKKWDENSVKGGLAHSIVFEGVERAAHGLKEEVLKGLCNESSQKEQALRHAAMAVAKRKTEIETQLGVRKKEVETIKQALIKAVTERCNELLSTLKAAAAEKSAALEKQGAGLQKGAESLQGAREGAEETLSSLVVKERPIEVVAACLKLKQELTAKNMASQAASAPVCEADLHAVFSTFNVVMGEVKQLGWSGALDVDVTKCTLSKRGDELVLVAGGSLEIILTTRDKLGQQRKAGGLDVKAVVEPEGSVDGRVAVADLGDGTYVISFKARQVPGLSARKDLSLTIEICGFPLRGSPFSLGISPSSIVMTKAAIKALHAFLPRKKLELCYRASRDGWDPADFHRLCDGKGATLVVVKEATKGYIFGGYTAVAWSSSSKSLHDNGAFLFSITNASTVPPLKIPYRAQYAAVLHNLSSGPVFGLNGDLALLVSGRSQGGSSQLCHDYAPPAGQSPYFLTGSSSNQFQLADMEVFLVRKW